MEYDLRRRNLASPLADVRGPTGRTRAIAAAIRTGLARGDDPDNIEELIRCAEAAGLSMSEYDRLLPCVFTVRGSACGTARSGRPQNLRPSVQNDLPAVRRMSTTSPSVVLLWAFAREERKGDCYGVEAGSARGGDRWSFLYDSSSACSSLRTAWST
ncbi:hypothetical protein W59_23945 [Rhodococcus opacus RKJ300 = JCM 13270]|uniref:Uncharacterized protein n=1 Tax=Rhodococcus opacus RKJ300 = JCM 13270 TaxID=1165867 RepID=I0WLS0_RHOOP|nr:hypothetical protein W59_23945 [Rhodococcus opacus RKJ300 = JCM 13270]